MAVAGTSPKSLSSISSSSKPPRLGKRGAVEPAVGQQVLPEDVGVREAVHQLHLP